MKTGYCSPARQGIDQTVGTQPNRKRKITFFDMLSAKLNHVLTTPSLASTATSPTSVDNQKTEWRRVNRKYILYLDCNEIKYQLERLCQQFQPYLTRLIRGNATLTDVTQLPEFKMSATKPEVETTFERYERTQIWQ